MSIIFVIISVFWVFCAYKLVKQSSILSGLLVNFILLTIAWAGLNALLGLITLFDFIESINQDLIASLVQDRTSLGWILFYFTNSILNVIFGAFLVSSQIKKIRGRTIRLDL
jgi:hypothetical protein